MVSDVSKCETKVWIRLEKDGGSFLENEEVAVFHLTQSYQEMICKLKILFLIFE